MAYLSPTGNESLELNWHPQKEFTCKRREKRDNLLLQTFKMFFA